MSQIASLLAYKMILLDMRQLSNGPNECAVRFYRDMDIGCSPDRFITINCFQTFRVDRNKSKCNK